MRVAVLIFCFLLLLQKSHSNAVSSNHTVGLGAVKAFVLERKNADALNLSANTGSANLHNGLTKASQALVWNYEEEDDLHVSDIKFKLICGVCLLLPSLYQTVLKYLSYNVYMHQHLNVQSLFSKYLLQRSLRI